MTSITMANSPEMLNDSKKIPFEETMEDKNESLPTTDLPEVSARANNGKDNLGKDQDELQVDEDNEALAKEEDAHGLARKTYFSRYRGYNHKLDERREKADMRLQQSKAYADLIEHRIIDIEEKLGRILDEPTKHAKLKEGLAPPSNKVEIKKLSWPEFGKTADVDPKSSSSSWRHRPELDSKSRYVIEMLMEEPAVHAVHTNTKAQQDGLRWKTGSAQEDSDQVERSSITVKHDRSRAPHRIRIRSRVLIKLLKDITGLSTVVGPHEHILVFMKPFKLLITHAKSIRTRLDELERKLLGPTGQNVPNGEPDTTELQLHSAAREIEADEARNHLELLCKMLDLHLQPKIDALQIKNKSSTVFFDDLWHIFKTGGEVLDTSTNQMQLYRIIKVTGGREVLSPQLTGPSNPASEKLKDKGFSSGSFILECFYVGFDGVQYGPVNETFQIRRFDGARDITSLPVAPLEYMAEDEEERRNKLLERGRKFAELCNPSKTAHKQYTGLTLDKRQEQVESEVIIDFQLAFIEQPENKPKIGVDNLIDDDPRELLDNWLHCKVCGNAGCCGNDIIYNDFEIDQNDREHFKKQRNPALEMVGYDTALTTDQMVLLPPKVFGFVLRTRRWATFDINLIEDVHYTDGWENLVIDPTMKNTVLALVENHQKSNTLGAPSTDGALSGVDLVQGKGKGLIILLHGEPGVGKTSTAECVADHTQRPLFPVTCGDIGDDALKVETNLERNFQLAHKWGCVLLLDEADIFLARRTANTDIARNAIVSVFLRSLEYYSGILFLTTNRVGTIDRAFKSRIHLALLYPRLDKDSTLKIWRNNLNGLNKGFEGKSGGLRLQEKEILEYAAKHYKHLTKQDMLPWNGRQIRNAFQTAIAIAKYEAKDSNEPPTLTVKHFRKVAKTAKEFDQYLMELSQDKDDNQIAMDQELRVNKWASSKSSSNHSSRMNGSSKGKRAARDVESESSSSDLDSSDDNTESDHNDIKNERKSKKRRKR
ncbi:P-loop containing nucleoside triphosphate hydrolase protein [Annulohypoxylon maeteangense]|uniref:P-loop containing nucleoside triphosphate hydrolase protein n=1 Tax=Annulohypoxylon maeteangense TaxID=1927788 RepID=UPI0020073E76|nr:P-loop containing nucleoside triphosphate hydrolase protein [Annulohypoxylon maeteangense]KAI0885474.1 P-loop containing nucleoside triphosphate hydrolase protein [Annulohypoxylon maeteangense]